LWSVVSVCSAIGFPTIYLYLQYMNVKANEVCKVTKNTFGKSERVHNIGVHPSDLVKYSFRLSSEAEALDG